MLFVDGTTANASSDKHDVHWTAEETVLINF